MPGYSSPRQLIDTFRRMMQFPPGQEVILSRRHDLRFTPEQYRAWFVRSLNAKINRGDPRADWRKMSDKYQIDMEVDRMHIQQYIFSRYRSSGSRGILRTPEMRRRYPHINNQPWED